MSDSTERTPVIKLLLKFKLLLLSIIIIIIGAILCATAIKQSTQIGVTATSPSFEEERQKVSDDIYNLAYNYSEEKYHVSNNVTLSIDNLQEINSLEILNVTDTEIVIKSDEKKKVEQWYMFDGEGVFTVNLENAEYIIDNIHKNVTVRIPKPQLTNVKIIHREALLNEDDFSNGSYSDGTALATEAIKDGERLIKEELNSSRYVDAAQKSAEIAIENLVFKFNPDVTDIKVVVEFMNNN